MNPIYNLLAPEDVHHEPVANIGLQLDGHGNVDVVINNEVVAFFNPKGEFWLVNFSENGDDGLGDLQRAGIKFERSKDDEEFFTLKVE